MSGRKRAAGRPLRDAVPRSCGCGTVAALVAEFTRIDASASPARKTALERSARSGAESAAHPGFVREHGVGQPQRQQLLDDLYGDERPTVYGRNHDAGRRARMGDARTGAATTAAASQDAAEAGA